MEIQKTEENNETKKEVDQTTDQVDESKDNVESKDQDKVSTDENKDWQPLGQEETEKLQKKATDFDAITKKSKLSKFLDKDKNVVKEDNKEEKPNEVLEEMKQIKSDLTDELSKFRSANRETIMTDAYGEFIKNNPWADNDDVISEVSKDFSDDGLLNKEQYVSKMESLALQKFPQKFKSYLENKTKQDLLNNDEIIDAGGSGGSGNDVKKDNVDKELTPEQVEFAEKCGNKPSEVYTN